MRIEDLNLTHMLALMDRGLPDAKAIIDKRGYFTALTQNGPCWAGVGVEGVIGAMGFSHMNAKNYRCWAVTDPILLPRYLAVVSKHMIRQMKALTVEGIANRIETIVQVDNKPAMRWVRLLGFERPHLMRNFNEYGDAWLYEKVPNG